MLRGFDKNMNKPTDMGKSPPGLNAASCTFAHIRKINIKKLPQLLHRFEVHLNRNLTASAKHSPNPFKSAPQAHKNPKYWSKEIREKTDP